MNRDFVLIVSAMNWWLLLIPLSSAFSCWLFAKITLTILFRPHHRKTIAGIKFQGILPAKQSAFADRIGKFVAEQFFSMKLIEQKITNPDNLQKIMPAIEDHIDDFLRNKLKKEMPVISMFIGDKTVTSMKKVFMTELENLFPQIMRSYANNLVNDLNIEQLVVQKIAALSITEIEKAFYQNLSKEIRAIKLVSISLGLIIGSLAMLVIILTDN